MLGDLEEHEQRALQHAGNIIFLQLRPYLFIAPFIALFVGLIIGGALVIAKAPGSLWRATQPTPQEFKSEPPPFPREEPPREHEEDKSAQLQQDIERLKKENESLKEKSKHPVIPKLPSTATLMRSVVEVTTSTGGGSGISVAYRQGYSYILTAKHVIENRYGIYVGETAARDWYTSDTQDLALIRVAGRYPTVQLADDYQTGEPVWSAAFLMHKQVIGQGTLVNDGAQYLRITSPVYYGMSGGGIFINRNGFKLIGTITNVGDCAPSCLVLTDAYAMSLKTINAFLREALPEFPVP